MAAGGAEAAGCSRSPPPAARCWSLAAGSCEGQRGFRRVSASRRRAAWRACPASCTPDAQRPLKLSPAPRTTALGGGAVMYVYLRLLCVLPEGPQSAVATIAHV
jgi:hypothetical protein